MFWRCCRLGISILFVVGDLWGCCYCKVLLLCELLEWQGIALAPFQTLSWRDHFVLWFVVLWGIWSWRCSPAFVGGKQSCSDKMPTVQNWFCCLAVPGLVFVGSKHNCQNGIPTIQKVCVPQSSSYLSRIRMSMMCRWAVLVSVCLIACCLHIRSDTAVFGWLMRCVCLAGIIRAVFNGIPTVPPECVVIIEDSIMRPNP